MIKIQGTAVALALCLLLSGCGSGSSSTENPESKAETTMEVTTAEKTTTTEKKEEPTMTLQKDGEYWVGKFFCEKLGYEIEVEAEGVSEDYVQHCAAQVENMSDALYDAIREAAKHYCLAFLRTEKDALGNDFEITEEYHKVTRDTPAEDVIKMITLDGLVIDEIEDENQLYFRLSGGCDWEIEHGIEADVLNGQLFYLGGFEHVDADSDYYRTGLGAQWNYALTFEELTAGVIEKIEGIEDLDKLEGVSEEEIDNAEQELELLFPAEYRAILLRYGSISFFAHDWTGLGFEGEGNVVTMTQRERELNEKLPAKFFVLENAGIDGIIIAANEFGEVYQVQYDEHKKIHDSILAYLEWCLRES